MPQTQEIELKFLCAPDDLGRVLAAAPAGDDDCRELISVYFDTPGRHLQKAGASLRVRESSGCRVQTLKRGDGLAREEYETPIAGDAPDPSLRPLPELLPESARGELRARFHVRVTRRQRLVRYAGSDIELALDQGEVRGGRRASPICEVELELKSGAPAALFGLARELGRAAPLYLSFATKSQRGQALVAGRPLHAPKKARAALRPDATVGDVFQSIARRCLAEIAGNAEVLRQRTDADAVHQLRVASRTLRSALSTFKEVLEDAERTRLNDELRWLAKACDDARNLDVFVEDLLEPAARLAAPPHGLDQLRDAVEAGAAQARAAASDAVGSARFRDLLISAAGWVDTGAWTQAPAAGAPARPFAARMLDKRLRRLMKDGRRLAEATDERRHAARIDAKKLRYDVEGFESVFGAKAVRRYVERLKAVQDELGALNDVATAEALIARLPLSPAAASAAADLLALKSGGKTGRIDRAAAAMRRLCQTDPFWD
jgi:inorganic triphosphatase YgiF